ncbi:MAG: hypothetical protein LBE25_09475 [Arthrobacter sp.]|nr:hypothetical protein [Arthrobacter sp.]
MLLALAGVYLNAKYPQPWWLPAAAGAAVLAALFAWAWHTAAKRERAREHVEALLVSGIGGTSLRGARIVTSGRLNPEGVPTSLLIELPAHTPMHDPVFRSAFEEHFHTVMGTPHLDAVWKPKRRTVALSGLQRPAKNKTLAPQRRKVVAHDLHAESRALLSRFVEVLYKGFFSDGGRILAITAPGPGAGEDFFPTFVQLSFGAAAPIHEVEFRKGFEEAFSTRMDADEARLMWNASSRSVEIAAIRLTEEQRLAKLLRTRATDFLSTVVKDFTTDGGAVLQADKDGGTGFANRLVIRFGSHAPVFSKPFREDMEEKICARMGADAVEASWNVAQHTVEVYALTLSREEKLSRTLKRNAEAFLNTMLPGFTADKGHISAAGAGTRNGFPHLLEVSFGPSAPLYDEAFRDGLEEKLRARMGVDAVSATWDIAAGTLTAQGRDFTARERAEHNAFERAKVLLTRLFGRVPLRIEVPEYHEFGGIKDLLVPTRVLMSYGSTTLDGSDLFKRRLEAVAALKFGGRWQANFDSVNDQGVLEPKPEMPTMARHPGLSLYPKREGIPKSQTLYYGVDEAGNNRGWDVGTKSTMPHALIAGPTGGGKTTVLRSLVMGAVACGMPVLAADPKRIELSPFVGFPGIWVATAPEDMANLIDSVHALMHKRNNQTEAANVTKQPQPVFEPVLVILDEYLILRQLLNKLWKEPVEDENGKTRKRTGDHEAFGQIQGMLALARSSNIHIVIGIQRPDASHFEQGARDNMQQRIALMRTSPQASRMLWNNDWAGTDLPLIQGRAMAAPDGLDPIEMQTFWIDDPINADGVDRETIEAFRARAHENFDGRSLPINVASFTLKPVTVDHANLPRPETAHGTEPAPAPAASVSASDALVDEQSVRCDELFPQDTVKIESDTFTVTAIDQDESDPGYLNLTLEDLYGAEQSMVLSETDWVTRVTDLSAESEGDGVSWVRDNE